MYIVQVQLDTDTTVNFDGYFQLTAGTKPQQMCLVFRDANSHIIDLSDKLAFISGQTPNGYNVEYCTQGNSQGQALFTLNTALTQASGAFKWLYVGIRDMQDNLVDCTTATMTILPNELNQDLDVGSYRDDWTAFLGSIEGSYAACMSEANACNSACSQALSAVSANSDAFNNFMSAASSENSTATSAAESYATSATDNVVSEAKAAVSAATSQITTNAVNIAATDGVLAAAMSNNLVANSDLLHSQNTTDNVAPDGAWISANGWNYIDKNGNYTKGCGRVWWYGHNCLQINGFDNTSVAAVSKPVYALNPLQANTISASFVAQLSGSGYSGVTVYVQASMDGYHWQMPSSSNSAYVVPINDNAISDSWATYSKENITIPKGYCWLRLLLVPSGANCYVWFSAPQINLGSTVAPYNSSSTPITAVVTQDYSSTTLANGATGSVTAERFNNLVVVRLIATGAKSGDIIAQLPAGFNPRISSQQASSVEADSGGLYSDFFGIDNSGNIVLYQRKFDNSLIPTINCNATFMYLIN